MQRGDGPPRDRLHDQEERVDADPGRECGEEGGETGAVVLRGGDLVAGHLHGIRDGLGLPGAQIGCRGGDRVDALGESVAQFGRAGGERGQSIAQLCSAVVGCGGTGGDRARAGSELVRTRGEGRGTCGELIDLSDRGLHLRVPLLQACAQRIEPGEHLIDLLGGEALLRQRVRDVGAHLWQGVRGLLDRRPRAVGDVGELSVARTHLLCAVREVLCAGRELRRAVSQLRCALGEGRAPGRRSAGAVGELGGAVRRRDELVAHVAEPRE